MNSSTQLLVISAHAADFVWRAAGAIAMVTQSGGTAKVIALSYGERGDITPVFEKKRAAMDVMGAQGYLREYYSQRASQRAYHARRICSDKEIKFSEAFQRITPTVLKGF